VDKTGLGRPLRYGPREAHYHQGARRKRLEQPVLDFGLFRRTRSGRTPRLGCLDFEVILSAITNGKGPDSPYQLSTAA